MPKRLTDFPPHVIRALAERAGHRCSFPGCNASTIGPSDESPTSISRTGMACHIVAASDGPNARRRDPSASKEFKVSIDNGIWLCYSHGKLVDTDEVRFSIQQLVKWRELAEWRARCKQSSELASADLGLKFGLPLDQAEMGLGEESLRRIPGFLQDSALELLWGRDLSRTLRDLILELHMNAGQHGRANVFRICLKHDHILVEEDGLPFNILDLLAARTESGGSHAMQSLFANFGADITISYERANDCNRLTIARVTTIERLKELSSCVYVVDQLVRRSVGPPPPANCPITYVVFPNFYTISGLLPLLERFRGSQEHLKTHLVFVLPEPSDSMIRHIRSVLPSATIQELQG